MDKTFVFIFICLSIFIKESHCIQCYKCESIDGSDIGCEIGRKDTPYSNPCYIGVGAYVKGNRCIKIVGHSEYGQRVVIRDCTDKTHDRQETLIEYDKRLINGHAYTCKSNLCNGSFSNKLSRIELIKLISSVVLALYVGLKFSKL